MKKMKHFILVTVIGLTGFVETLVFQASKLPEPWQE